MEYVFMTVIYKSFTGNGLEVPLGKLLAFISQDRDRFNPVYCILEDKFPIINDLEEKRMRNRGIRWAASKIQKKGAFFFDHLPNGSTPFHTPLKIFLLLQTIHIAVVIRSDVV